MCECEWTMYLHVRMTVPAHNHILTAIFISIFSLFTTKPVEIFPTKTSHYSFSLMKAKLDMTVIAE